MDLDLGAFELVDSGMTAETLLSTEDPVIFHKVRMNLLLQQYVFIDYPDSEIIKIDFRFI